jgi:hypothetical protein
MSELGTTESENTITDFSKYKYCNQCNKQVHLSNFKTDNQKVYKNNCKNHKERILHLTLKKEWYDMIASGVKKEEYREIKPHWNKRLLNKTYDVIIFRNGYSKDSPSMKVEFLGLQKGLGIEEWGANLKEKVYIIKLGKIIWNNALM